MEPWQIEHIQKNFYNLTNISSWNVRIAAILEQEGILSSGEIEELNYERPGNAVFNLYRMIQKRPNGYETLCGALLNECQSGPYNILIDGYERKLLSLIQQDFPSFKIEDVKEILKKNELQAEYKKTFIPNYKVGVYNYSQQPENFVILNQTVPEVQSTYVQRLISNRVLLDPKVFQPQKDIFDVFVFKGLLQSELSVLAMSCESGTMASSDKIFEFNNKQRFVLLEEEKHWPKLASKGKSQQYSCPVHLINVEKIITNRNYILEETTHISDNIRNNRLSSKLKQEKLYNSEQEFVKKFVNSVSHINGICICGSPGIGKSRLIESLANQFKTAFKSKNDANKIVAVFSLPHITEVIQQNKISALNQNHAIECIFKELCPENLLSKEVLKYAWNKQLVSFYLFFDGFDEVAENHQESVIEFFKVLISDAKFLRIFVTSRKHMREKLERELSVLAYDILPFNQSSQVSYLSDHWRKKFEDSDPVLLKEFASILLNKLRDAMNAEEKDIYGNPFMCYMVAEVFGEQAELYRKGKDLRDTNIFSQYEIYVRLFNLRLSTSNVSKKFLIWKAFTVLFPNFAHKIKLVLGSWNEQSEQNQFSCGILHKRKHGDIFKTEFIHQTLAEFLVAEFLGQSIFSEFACSEMRVLCLPLTMEQEKSVILFFAEEILEIRRTSLLHIEDIKLRNHFFYMHKFTYCGILNFLDSNIHKYCEDKLRNLQMLTFKKEDLPTKLLASPEKLINIFQCCILHNFVYIFRALCSSLRMEELKKLAELQCWLGQSHIFLHAGKNGFCKCDTFSRSENFYCTKVTGIYFLIMSAVIYSGRNMLEACFDLIDQVCIPNDDIFRYSKYPVSPLLVAMKKYYLVETFLKKEKEHKAGKAEIHIEELCIYVSHTESLSDQEIQNRKNMCDLLLTDNECLIKQFNSNERTVLHCPNMHLELIKFLISKNADITATDEYNRTFIHWVTRYMTSKRFHELCEYLFVEKSNTELIEQAKTLFTLDIADKNNSNNPLCYVLKHFEENLQYDTFNIILEATKIDIDSLFLDDVFGTINLLMAAMLGNQSLDIIKEMVDKKINTQYTNEKGFNVLSFVVEIGNVQYADFFYSLGVSIDEEKVRDDQRNFRKAYKRHNSVRSHVYILTDEGDSSIQNRDIHWEFYNKQELLSWQDKFLYPNLPLKNKMVNYLCWRVFDAEEIGYCWVIYKGYAITSLCDKIAKAVTTVNYLNANPSAELYKHVDRSECWGDDNELTLSPKSLSDARHFDLSSKHKLLIILTKTCEILPPYLMNALDLDATKRVKDAPAIIDLAAKVEDLDLVKYIFLLDMSLNYLGEKEMISLYEELIKKNARLPKQGKKPSTDNIKDLLNELLLTLLKLPEYGSKNTYLHYAASYYDETGFNATIQTLQKHGHDNLLLVRNSKGQTPLHLAISHDCFGVETFDILKGSLTETGGSGSKKPKISVIDWNESDNDGHSYIHYALFRTDKDMSFFERLVKLEGIDLSKTDNENRSIAEICYSLGLSKHSKLLEDLGKNDFENDLVEPNHFNQIEKFCHAEIFPRKLFETAVAKSCNVDK